MIKRFKYYSIFVIFGLWFLLLILLRSHDEHENPTTDFYYNENRNRGSMYNNEIHNLPVVQTVHPIPYVSSLNIDNFLHKTRLKIESELLNYNYTLSGVNRLEDLLLESGGKPIRNVIVSTWRSGSTFLGQVLNAMPANFYHYEPFFEHKLQIRGAPLAKKALKVVKNLLECKYDDMKEYFDYRISNPDQFTHNTRLWELCKYNKNLCFNPDFMTKICRLFPFQSMKLVRFRLHLVKKILDDDNLNVKFVLLVRDPRGVLQSRRFLQFCQRSADCREPERLCADMVNDYFAAQELIRKYPTKLIVVRYEELALNPMKTTYELYKFLRLGGIQSVESFLSLHTKVELPGVTSTYRLTREVPFKWRDLLTYNYVDEIQTACKAAMRLWGYRMAQNTTHMKSQEFYPLDRYSI